jgi:hypothetical protein
MNEPDDPRRPYIRRTSFTPINPPNEIELHFCPACGALIRGSYNLDPAKKRCTKTWHLATPVPRMYRAVDV